MKDKIKRVFSGILTILFVITGMLNMTANAANQEIFPANSRLDLFDNSANMADDLSPDSESRTHFDPATLHAGELELVDGGESLSAVGDVHLGAGEEQFVEGSRSPTYGNVETELGAPILMEDKYIAGPISAASPSAGTGSGNVSVSFSSERISVDKNRSAAVRVRVTGHRERVNIQFRVNPNNPSVCSAAWGSWSGSELPLTLTGNEYGANYVYVFVKSVATGNVLAAARAYVTVAGSLQLTSDSDSVNVIQGSATQVHFSHNEFKGSVYYDFGTTNTVVYQLSWGSASPAEKGVLTIRGVMSGTGEVKVYLKDFITNEILAVKTITVTVSSNARLVLSATNLTVVAGDISPLSVTYSNYSGSVYLKYMTTEEFLPYFEGKFTRWSGKTCHLNINGAEAGIGLVRVCLMDSLTDKELTHADCNLQIVKNPSVSASKTNLSLKAGETVPVTFAAGGIVGQYTVKYHISDPAYIDCAKWGKWKNNEITLKIIGKNPGTTTVEVFLLDPLGDVVSSVKVAVTVTTTNKPSISVSSSSVSLREGNTSTLIVSCFDVPRGSYLQYGTTGQDYYNCSWGGQSGYMSALNISAANAGAGNVTVYLKRSSDNKVLSSRTISTNVRPGANHMENISYSFENFHDVAPTPVCKYMFGDTSLARTVQRFAVGSTGNCFGMSATAGLFYSADNGVSLSSFRQSAQALAELNRYDENTRWGLTLDEFIMAMHLTQVSEKFEFRSIDVADMGSVANMIIAEMASNHPVLIGLRGVYKNEKAGHALLAYGVEEISPTRQRLLVYDSNYPMQTRAIELVRGSNGSYSSWTYRIDNGTTWGSGRPNSSFGVATYNMYYQQWSNRASLSDPRYNVIAANSRDLTLYDVFDNELATVENGQLTYDAIEARVIQRYSLDLKETPTDDIMLLVPVDLYTVKNNDNSVQEFEVEVVNVELGTKVKTSGDSITLCADDSCNFASALLLDSKDERFEITLSSSRAGEPETVVCSGVAEADVLSIMMNDGSLNTCNVDGASMSLGAVNSSGSDTFIIRVEAGDHGTVTSDEPEIAAKGENRTYSITPDAGYVIDDVVVDNVSVGEVSSYTFENIAANHTLQAFFTEDEGGGKLGDVNGDGQVDANDLTALARHVAKIEQIRGATLLKNADVTGDGQITADDLTMLARYVAKIINKLG